MFHNRRPLAVLLLASVSITLIIQQITGLQTVLSQSQTLKVASDDLVAPIGDRVSRHTFTVPEGAVNPRLIGTYEVISGLDIDVDVRDKETCPSDIEHEGTVDCVSVYSAPSRDSGDVDVALTPGKTYILEFFNPGGYFAGERTTKIDFHVQYD